MNEKINLVSGILPDTRDFIKKYQIASITDLLKLKSAVPNCGFRYTDITPHIKQNCDATSRVLTKHTIKHLTESIPGSSATQLYLIAAESTHEPYRNKKFGPPPEVARSLGKVYLYGVDGESMYV